MFREHFAGVVYREHNMNGSESVSRNYPQGIIVTYRHTVITSTPTPHPSPSLKIPLGALDCLIIDNNYIRATMTSVDRNGNKEIIIDGQ